MELYLDTASLEEIREAAKWGVISGVTTNPTLMAREGNVDFSETIKKICDIIDGPISAEVVSVKAEDMIEEARPISRWHPNVVVKIPMTPDGLQAIKVLSGIGKPLAGTLGARGISCRVGDDLTEDGVVEPAMHSDKERGPVRKVHVERAFRVPCGIGDACN